MFNQLATGRFCRAYPPIEVRLDLPCKNDQISKLLSSFRHLVRNRASRVFTILNKLLLLILLLLYSSSASSRFKERGARETIQKICILAHFNQCLRGFGADIQ
jgi:hypothetical protein